MLIASTIAHLGRGVLLVGFVASFFGAFAAAVGAKRSDHRTLRLVPRFVIIATASAVGAFAVMEWAMITRDFSLDYVQKVGSRSTPALYNFAAVWSALEGSILMWVLVLAGYLAAATWWMRRRISEPLVGYALAVLLAVLAYFFLLSFGPANPFVVGAPGVTDGPGPNPLLQNHLLVMFHPPILYLGYVGMTVPFAFAVAALITGKVDDGWLHVTRRWTLAAWGFLTFGIALGGWWSYEVLGWSGVWAWDPVENASLLPWITGTAYIHSVMVQERRGLLRVWNISLLIATFSLTILGTFLTRSGVLNSVHAFSESDIGPWLLVAFGVIVAASLVLVFMRGDQLRSAGTVESIYSREGAFLLNNILFAVFAFVVLLGTVFPLVVEALQQRQIVVGEPFFDQLTVPIGITMLFIMAVGPVLPWRRSGRDSLGEKLLVPAIVGLVSLGLAVVVGANGLAPLLAFGLGGFAAGSALAHLGRAIRVQRLNGFVGRSNGGMIVHLGVIMICVALAASNSFTRSQEIDLVLGREASFAGHTFELVGFEESSDARSNSVRALVSIDGGQAYAPAITKFTRIGMNVGTPSVRTSLTHDIYLTLEPPVRQDSGQARIKVFVKPMILWLWVGTFVMAAGTALAIVPRRRGARRADATLLAEPAEQSTSP
ncbi:MAG: heme lyase CcmF/NrfE family subunit [Ilumatobacteraceae bacterium]|jgi:cytochrome c-type biogenesis protein CcmF|nr:heme lyase CcmF/NrfE family subunit [Actinomycetota bacterium]NDD17339.1 heme lyase CcmF/NrfE family subunit [Acidimicrobiia bacterium]NCV08915.1 heme lyase CcmF/NrfE family subunit [Actinomycetota bacterium]NCV46521.1 heme lyase CcmF/NrfE family subunit [Actinomycetota bacterium]NCZ86920.1 heme lyase CcmF/NrfE family subunit [Actinomycetota bacterium]